MYLSYILQVPVSISLTVMSTSASGSAPRQRNRLQKKTPAQKQAEKDAKKLAKGKTTIPASPAETDFSLKKITYGTENELDLKPNEGTLQLLQELSSQTSTTSATPSSSNTADPTYNVKQLATLLTALLEPWMLPVLAQGTAEFNQAKGNKTLYQHWTVATDISIVTKNCRFLSFPCIVSSHAKCRGC